MKLSNLILVLFFLLVPNQHFQNCELKGALCDYAPGYQPRKKADDQATDKYMSACYYSKANVDSSREGNDPLPVKIHYGPSGEEKCLKDKKIISKELTREEIEAVKLAATKCRPEKPKKQEQMAHKPAEKTIKVDFAKDEFTCSRPQPEKKSILCAECEECELLLKANGEGVLLKCQNCHEVPPDEITFLSGNNRKIIRLP